MSDTPKAALKDQLKRGLTLLKKRQYQPASEVFEQAVTAYPNDASAQLLFGLTLCRISANTEAVEAIEKAVSMAPNSASIVSKATKALNKAKRPYRSLHILQTFLNDHPDHVEFHAQFSNMALQAGWYWEGFKAMRRAIELDPTTTQRRIGLARLLYNLRDYDAAVKILKPVFETEQEATAESHYLHAEILKEMGDLDAAIESINLALEKKERTTETLLQTAVYLIQLGDLKTAKSCVREALEQDKDSLEALKMSADFALWNGQYDEAKQYGELILKDDPERPEGRRIKAACLTLKQKYDEAKPILDALIEENEQDSIALLLRGEVKRALRDFDSAVIDIDMGIIHGHGYAIQANVSRLLTITEQQNQNWCDKMAKDAYEELLHLAKPLLPEPEIDIHCNGDPRDVRRLMLHIFASFKGNRTSDTTYIREDDPGNELKRLHTQIHSRFASRYAQELIRTRTIEEVLDYFDKMIAEDPENPIVYTHSGEVLLWLGRYEESLTEFKKSIAITPKVRWAYIGLCANELMLGRYQEALNWCKKGLKAFPPPGRTMFPYRAEVYRRMGRLDEALEDIRKAQEMTPGRMTGWMNEALIYGDRGDDSYLVPAYIKVAERCPCLVETALKEMNDPFPLEKPTTEGIPEVFEHMMTMMRGNRSSDFVTYFTKDGHFRFVPPPDVPDFVNNI